MTNSNRSTLVSRNISHAPEWTLSQWARTSIVLKAKDRGMPQMTTVGIQPASSSSTKCLRGNPGAQTTQVRSSKPPPQAGSSFPSWGSSVSQAPGAAEVMGSCTAHQGYGSPMLLGAKELPRPLMGAPGAAERVGTAPWRSKAPGPAGAAACASETGLPRVQSMGRPGRTPPSACPDPCKDSIPGPGGLRHPRRAPKPSPRP